MESIQDDEMFTAFKYKFLPQLYKVYGQSLCSVSDPKAAAKAAAIAKAQAKEIAKKEKAAALVPKTEKKEKKVKSYVKDIPTNEISNQNLSLEEAIAIKSDVSKMLDSYDPAVVEKHWYQWWEKNKFFTPNALEALKAPQDERYIMVVPPPNVTGYLHIGHGLTAAIEDCLIRWRRMQGKHTLYLPGTDHAGIATQSVVEKTVWKNEKKTRHDYGREEFVKKIWEWKDKHGNQILEQFRRIGSSFDWDHFAFTMDNTRSKAVTEAFVQLFDKGLIYRSNRLVNWSCKLQTGISDIEVDFKDIKTPTIMEVPGHSGKYEFGTLTKFAYKVKDLNEEIVVATTRLETMLGDVAVAVNSKDPRYTHLIGKELIHPFIPDRKMKVIADDILVDMNFGTGAVKITPGHDFNDYECGQRHNLEIINILNKDGTINENGGKYSGQMRFDVRNSMYSEMESLGILRGKEPNEMRLGICSRSGDVIEPILTPQWYMKCEDIAKEMIKVVETKELRIIPESYESIWFHWLKNIKDWCISRQLWWGHRCPAYIVQVKGGKAANLSSQEDFVVARNEKEAMEKAKAKFGLSEDQIVISQDEDVLDTWFSSALFPFSTMHWPDTEHPSFKAFYPNTILETGHDILFFWVARMVMMGLLLLNKLPFTTVFLHPIIRDALGRKMSKSLGNVIDPLEIVDGSTLQAIIEKVKAGNFAKEEEKKAIEAKTKEYPNGITTCGADALRFGLLSYMVQGHHINLNVNVVISYRQFCNKIWNTFKLFNMKLSPDFVFHPNHIKPQEFSLPNKWILVKADNLVKKITTSLEEYYFGEAANSFFNFWLNEFSNTYMEIAKIMMKGRSKEIQEEYMATMFFVIETGLRLLHPMMPFITEELYQKLRAFEGKKISITIAPYPKAQNWNDDETLSTMETLMEAVKGVRSVCSNVNLPPSISPKAFITKEESAGKILTPDNVEILKSMGKLSTLDVTETIPAGTASVMIPKLGKLHILVKEHIDISKEIERVAKSLEGSRSLLEKYESKTRAADYSSKVPLEVQNLNAEKIRQLQETISLGESSLSMLKSL